MRKHKFNLKTFIGIAAMFLATTAHAQAPAPPSGKTHCTTTVDDCTLGGRVSITFTFSTGGFLPIGSTGEYKVKVDLYKGEWTSAGWGYTITNEELRTTSYSVKATNPPTLSTSAFYSAGIVLAASNGAYRAKTTLYGNTTSNGWVEIYTTTLSPVYAVNDVPPHAHIGDWSEVARVENLNVGSYFDYRINGYPASTPPKHYITCAAVPLMVTNVSGGVDNPGTSTLTVQKGTMVGNTFDPGSNLPVSTTFATTSANQNLTSLFSLAGYTGALKITYRIPDDVCGGTSTPVSKSMVITVATAAFLNDYKAPTHSGASVVPGCGSSASTKPISTTWNIPTITMPSSTVMNEFKCGLKYETGWQGASSAGISDLNYAGAYSVDVYEVSNSTGVRLAGAPSLFLKSGTAVAHGNLTFGEYGYSAGFDISAGAPFYVGEPANGLGVGSGYNYFNAFYEAARTNPGVVGNLTAFSARVFCVDVSQYPEGGCVVSKKSYFRIANNGLMPGSTARLANSSPEDTEEEYPSLEVYPNPTKGELVIPVTEDDINIHVSIMDNLGKEVYRSNEIRHGNINIENLTAGIYFYTIHKNGQVYRGKVVKE